MTDKPNGEIKIDKGVPLSPVSSRQKYPFHAMDIGDSFFLPERSSTKSGNLHQFARNQRVSIKTRTVTENGVKGVRVWRIA